jgi:hypothetical protein
LLSQTEIPDTATKKLTIETLSHDLQAIVPVLKTCGLPKNATKNLIGDGGYLMKEADKKQLANTMNAKIIAPYRRNQKKKNTEAEKQKLKNRSAIERKFSSVKHRNNPVGNCQKTRQKIS